MGERHKVAMVVVPIDDLVVAPISQSDGKARQPGKAFEDLVAEVRVGLEDLVNKGRRFLAEATHRRQLPRLGVQGLNIIKRTGIDRITPSGRKCLDTPSTACATG